MEKLQWVHVRLTRKAHVALTRVNHNFYQEAMKALKELFDPHVVKELYKTELRSRVKWQLESWGDYADQLSVYSLTKRTQNLRKMQESISH